MEAKRLHTEESRMLILCGFVTTSDPTHMTHSNPTSAALKWAAMCSTAAVSENLYLIKKIRPKGGTHVGPVRAHCCQMICIINKKLWVAEIAESNHSLIH